jgi:UDP-3-O-[3-hydroxymyristoyl] glucosamine N-acyltransferase
MVGGELINPLEGMDLRGVKPPEIATRHDVVFVFRPTAPSLLTGDSRMVVTPSALPNYSFCQLIHPKPRLAMAVLLQHFHPQISVTNHAIAPTAVIADTAAVDAPVSLGDYVCIGARTRIGEGTRIHPQVVIGADCHIGKHCVIYPHVTINDRCSIGDYTVIHANSSIGTDGFSYEYDGTNWVKMPQLGGVVIHDHVDIGSHTAVDAGGLSPTIIETGVKIDNHVHVAHNCHIHARVVIAGGVIIGGSTQIGEGVIIAGDVTLSDHISIAPGSVVLGRSGVTKSIKTAQTVSGYPAQEHRTELKYQSYLKRLFRLNN